MSAAKKARVEEEPSEIMGYIHNVSPIKLSRNNNKYFNAVFQDHEKYSDLVCFVPENLDGNAEGKVSTFLLSVIAPMTYSVTKLT